MCYCFQITVCSGFGGGSMKVKLRDVSNIIMGQSPDSSTYNTEKIGLPFFQGNADFGELNPIAKTWCSAPIKIAYKNYILISVRAPIGALNIAAETCCIGRGLAAFDVNNKMCTQKYLWYLLKAKKNELLSKGTGSTFKAISKNILSEMEFNIPPVREQELCTKVLDVVFCLIRLKKEQLDKLDLLVKSRFIEMFGDPYYNPKGWHQATLNKVCYYIKDGPHKSLQDLGEGNGHPFISVRNIINGKIDFSTAKYISDSDYDEAIRKCHPEKGDILYSKGGTTGIAKLIDIDVEFANWVHVAVLKFDKNKINGVFFENMLNSDYCYTQSQRLTKGIANRDLVLSAMAKIELFVPPIDLQNKFADFVAQVDKSKFVVTAKFQ